MKLLATIVLLLTSYQVNYAQSEKDTVVSISGTTKLMRPPHSLYFSMINYPVTPSPQVKLPLSASMALCPVYSPDYLTKYQVSGSADPVGILAEMVVNSAFYVFEQRVLQKYDQKYWRLFWPP